MESSTEEHPLDEAFRLGREAARNDRKIGERSQNPYSRRQADDLYDAWEEGYGSV